MKTARFSMVGPVALRVFISLTDLRVAGQYYDSDVRAIPSMMVIKPMMQNAASALHRRDDRVADVRPHLTGFKSFCPLR
jgi:hypothetical protein